MKETVGKVLGSILRSTLISIVMFLVVFSVITGEFPPNLSRIKTAYQSLQRMTQLSREIQNKQKALQNQYAAEGMVEDADVQALQELNLKRAEIGANLLGDAAPPEVSSKEMTELKKQVQEMQNQVFRLQQRVNELEGQSK
ncbi:hypothetical protein [Bdellovibrio reynosensis]|uniref:Uncharacterized protein n=1 Tax=Bdellovibrio reynosensis TaxID=2835041 RepID=A0ABY4C7Q9_9BACT|nr:hypothetical protein [Bdellovibrio reynosensis]UOE99715.1 hypothetical protein MNR06_08405 [Bdellovibrio reynosensis]